jgi:lipoprotein-releasing system permease protein
MNEGEVFRVTDTARTEKVIISKKISDMLRLKTGDSFAMHFVQDPPRMRKFVISVFTRPVLKNLTKCMSSAI